MKFIEMKAPAKINIGLNILNRRSDGYHNLSTIFYPIIDMYDTLLVEHCDSFSFLCNSPNIPLDESNLVVKAVKILENETNKRLRVKIELIKRIPVQAGLGGGSSDAGAALISLNEFFKLGLGYDKLLRIALQLGSDVPFFIKAKPAIGTSRGEVLEPIDLEIEDSILIVNPLINISTKEAFQNISTKDRKVDFKQSISNGKLIYEKVRISLKNDFEEYAFSKYPELKRIKELMYNYGAEYASMSGSGSSIFGIFKDRKISEEAANSFPSNYFVFKSTPHL